MSRKIAVSGRTTIADGVCEELLLTVRGSSFEDAKRKMEAALQAHIERVLHKHPKANRKQIA
jgi:hypothetical protein